MSDSFGAIFDMDGVLVHSNPVHEATIKEFCKKHNRVADDAFLRERIFGRTNKEWIPELFGEISDEELSEYADEKEAMFRERFDPIGAEIRGATSFLKELHKRSIPCALATSAPAENATFILDKLNIQSYFSAVLDSSHVEKGKPDPDVYLKAADALKLKPSNCIVFEDSLAGVEAGIRAGANVVGITSTHTPEELNSCIKTYNHFDEIDVDELLNMVK
jgi:HAD superfamily hydrolase (TIGR01509 family)